jgi:hypothetical protein
MSYDISLVHPTTKEKYTLDEPKFMVGQSFNVFDGQETCLNVTYNYRDILIKAFGNELVVSSKLDQHLGGPLRVGIRTIYNLTGEQSIPVLENAINSLSDDTSPYYWASTEGNVKKVLKNLLFFAKLFPEGIWEGD